MHVHSKALATIEPVEDDSEFGPNGGFIAVLSTPDQDRDGDRLQREEWMEPLPESCPLDLDHGMTVATTIGSFQPYFDGKRLMMRATYSSLPRAQEARTLVNEKHIRTVSVAFMTDKSKKSGEPRRELLNAGIVAIPANRDAVITESKALDLRAAELAEAKVGRDEVKAASGGDTALAQAIHDASVHLGAQCTAPPAPVVAEPIDNGTGADDGANKSFAIAGATGTPLDGFLTIVTKSVADTLGITLKDADADDDPKKLLAGIDAILDEAIKLTADVDRATLPEAVAQALDLLVGAEESVDSLMAEMGVFDPDDADEAEEKSADNVETDSKTPDLEQFEAALDTLTKSSEGDSPAESPADDAAAASDEEPAPADDAAEDAAESDAETVAAKAMRMKMSLFASRVSSGQ